MSTQTELVIALAGNPNSGKTTVFNSLTGSRQHVGNYPGVTVEKKEGSCRRNGRDIKVIDLPGTYSLSAHSIEEIVACKCILDETPDVVVNIVDASNLERNLYLSIQLMEIGVPMVMAFNMSDMLKKKGLDIDMPRLSALFRTPIVPTVGSKGEGLDALLDAATTLVAQPGKVERPVFDYGKEIEDEIEKIAALLVREHGRGKSDSRWVALKILEKDPCIVERYRSPSLTSQVETSRRHLEKILGDQPEILIADRRYGFISGACKECVNISAELRHEISDRVDAVLINRALGLPIFLGLMYIVFYMTFKLGEPPMGWIESFFGWLSGVIGSWWPAGSESVLKSLLLDGIIGGVGGVIVFLPNIMLLFLAIGILEDSGYMARAAFLMDRMMHMIGLHGKSFIAMLIGFGCSVPAIMATRTLDSQRDRLTTMLVMPLISCGARLPIYALLIPAFFPPSMHAGVLLSIYLSGIVLAIVLAKVLRSTLFKGDATLFLMELPPYRMPTVKGVLIHMWERGMLYLQKAGTIILGVSILLWVLTSYPKKAVYDYDFDTDTKLVEAKYPDKSGAAYEEEITRIENSKKQEELSYSMAGRIGMAIEPVLAPLGFDWRIGTALIGAFAAKEVFVAQMGIVYAVGEADETSEALRKKLRADYSPLQAFCIMIFCLISAPCMATIAITRRESNSWKWAFFQLGGLTLLAYVLTFVVFQAGTLLRIGIN